MSGAILIDIIIVVTIGALMLLVAILFFRKLRENDKLKYEFVTIIAHKFRTPLTQIKWSIEGLVDGEQDAYRKQALNEIGISNDNLIKLTGTLVELTDAAEAGKSDYKIERINICELARLAMEASKTLFHSKNLFMSVACSEPEIFVEGDVSRLEFVLSTLFDNACSYSTPGRNISVAVTGSKKHAMISVVDDGIGIDAHEMPHIFSKFYRTKQAQAMDTEGLGVALFLAKSVVKRHNGKIQVFSAGLNKGSTFSVQLPRVR